MATKAKATVAPSLIENPWHLFSVVAPYSRRIILHSEMPGTGKTSAGIMLAEALGAKLTVLTCAEGTMATDWVGHYMPKGTEWSWHDKPALRALRQAQDGNSVLLLNELDNAGPDIQQTLYQMTETGKTASFNISSGEVITIPPSFYVIATMNPNPKEVLTPALLSRFQCVIDVENYVSPMILAALPDALRSMVSDGRMASREAFAILDLTANGCPIVAACQAVLGKERCADYIDALAIALS